MKGFKSFKLIDQVKEDLFKNIKSLSSEKIDTKESFGRILANDIISPVNIPHFSRSAMDGYAIKAEDTFGASQRNPKIFEIIDKVEINTTSNKEIEKNQAIEIPTGAPIPQEADAVIKLEDIKRIDNKIEVYFPVSPHKNVSLEGEDVKKGETIIKAGQIIRSQEITLLLACNILETKVVRKPKIAIITTGSELIEPGKTPKIGQIVETNSYTIASLCEVYGGKPLRFGIVEDNEFSLKKILDDTLKFDMIVFTGGSSVGERDLIPFVINENFDNQMLAHGISMRPGSPTAIFIVKDTPVFCLPGFPVATMISFEVFVGPTIRKMLNANILDPRPVIKAILTRQIPSQYGRRDFARVKLNYDPKIGKYLAEPVRISGSGIISSVVKAEGIIEVKEDLEGYEKNSEVDVKLYLPR